MPSQLTIVTGIWNIGRDGAGEGFKRQYEHYLENFIKLLNSLQHQNVLVYIEKQYKDLIPHHPSHVFYEREISWFRRMEFYSKIQDIRNNKMWLDQAAWLKNSTQATLELYNPLVMSKYFLLHDATIFNPFRTEYFVWLDGGITNTVHPGYFSHDKVFDKLIKYLDPFLFVAFPYAEGPEIHGFTRAKINELCSTKNVEYVCRGGIFGGHIDTIKENNNYYYSLLHNTLKQGYMGTEESIFTIMSYNKPEVFRRSMINGNGLLNTFFENLKTESIQLLPDTTQVNIKPLHENKLSIYTLTFNSPGQFEKSCISWLSQKGRYDSCRKILINNSTKKDLIPKYDVLCKKYGFEHNIMDKNLGICGGRQFIAEHFNESDSDYYIFLEDDMFANPEITGTCKNGFPKYVPDLINKALKITLKNNYDFVKFCFTEFYGDNSTQWSWYNIPQHVRQQWFPKKTALPVLGLDPDAPKTVFNNIKSLEGVSYADGEIYYCNWPQIVSRAGNKKMFIDTKWAHPYEQTWMSHFFQMMKQGKLRSAVLLASPITHDRFDNYEAKLRKEN